MVSVLCVVFMGAGVHSVDWNQPRPIYPPAPMRFFYIHTACMAGFPHTLESWKILDFHFESSRSGNVLEFCGKILKFLVKPLKKMLSVEHSIILMAFCIQKFSTKIYSDKTSEWFSNFHHQSPWKSQRCLGKYLEQSLNFSYAKVWEPWYGYFYSIQSKT